MRIIFLSLPILGILSAISFAIFDAVRPQPEPSITQPLDSLIPRDLPGWTVKDLPLAETEELRGRVEEMLDFDDYVSRIYTRGSTQLILYIAYWKPGSAPIKQAHEHTPDICWVLNGWEPKVREHGIDLDLVFATDAHPAEFRIFEKNNTEQSVVFWHVVGNDIYTNERNDARAVTPSLNFLKTIQQFGLNQKREQFFVRVSSNRDVRIVLNEPSTAPLREHLAEIARVTPPVES
ncbi:MAG: exosortase-associated EpsI family protein [Opitutales bacterium]|nr:exosortase-associated EpsI family protein [Opitutales bacterium]